MGSGYRVWAAAEGIKRTAIIKAAATDAGNRAIETSFWRQSVRRRQLAGRACSPANERRAVSPAPVI